MSILIIGQGRVGSTFAHVLGAKGHSYQLVGYRDRAWVSLALDGVERVVLAVRDDQIEATSAEMAKRAPAAIHLHCSASYDHTLLSNEAAGRAAIHPLFSFPSQAIWETLTDDEIQANFLSGAHFFCQGDDNGLAKSRTLIEALGAQFHEMSVHGPAYHAAASITANITAAHAALFEAYFAERGLSHRAAEKAIAALLHSVADNIEREGFPDAVTGPVVRGDVEVVKRQLNALPDNLRRVYEAGLPELIAFAHVRGVPKTKLDALSDLIVSTGTRRSQPITKKK